MPKIQFPSVCYYIISLGIIFSCKGLITIDQQNQTVSIFNAFFQYRNETSDVTEARVDLLNQVIYCLRINNGSDLAEEILDMKYVNETYQCVINVGLFSHCGNITAYLSEIFNVTKNKTISTLREIVSKNLLKNYANNNLCSLQNATFLLTPLAIEKFVQDYVWPAVTQIYGDKHVEDGHPLNRSKRQALGSTNDEDDLDINDASDNNLGNIQSNSDDENYIDVVSEYEPPTKILKFDNNADYNFLRTLKHLRDKGLTDVKQNKEFLKFFRMNLNELALSQTNENWMEEPIKLWYSESTDRWNIVEFLSHLEGKQFFFNDLTLLRKVEDGKLPWNIWRPYEALDVTYRIYYYITINSQYGFVHLGKSENFNNHYITFSDVNFDVTGTHIATKEDKKTLKIYLTNHALSKQEWTNNRHEELESLRATKRGKSERMQSIENAADLITSIVPMHTFEMSVNILKGYILKLEETTLGPSYYDLARNLCNNLKISASYNEWKIPRNPLTEEVLFETDFDTSMSYMDLLTKMNGSFKKNCLRFNENDYNKYKNSSWLRKNLRIEDYFILTQFLQWQSEHRLIDNSKRRLFVALYRLALKECEEKWIESNITVYHVKYERLTHAIFEKLYSDHNYILRNIKEFSSHFAVEENKLRIMDIKTRNPVWMQIEFLNQAGMVNIDPLFDNSTGRYIIFPKTFPVTQHECIPIAGKSVLLIKLEDKRSKESKMIEMIEKLNEILTKFPKLFDYYN